MCKASLKVTADSTQRKGDFEVSRGSVLGGVGAEGGGGRLVNKGYSAFRVSQCGSEQMFFF